MVWTHLVSCNPVTLMSQAEVSHGANAPGSHTAKHYKKNIHYHRISIGHGVDSPDQWQSIYFILIILLYTWAGKVTMVYTMREWKREHSLKEKGDEGWWLTVAVMEIPRKSHIIKNWSGKWRMMEMGNSGDWIVGP